MKVACSLKSEETKLRKVPCKARMEKSAVLTMNFGFFRMVLNSTALILKDVLEKWMRPRRFA